MNYFSLNATFQAWGGLVVLAVLGTLVYFHAWGPLAFIVVLMPVVGYVETLNSSSTPQEKPCSTLLPG